MTRNELYFLVREEKYAFSCLGCRVKRLDYFDFDSLCFLLAPFGGVFALLNSEPWESSREEPAAESNS